MANDAAMGFEAKSGKIQGANSMAVWDDNCSYYRRWAGKTRNQQQRYKAMTLLLWHAIKRLKTRQYQFL